jgi:hypothetical protein
MTNEQNDKHFHDFFRQTLNDYRPEGNLEKDWEKLYPNLKRRSVIWWSLGGLGMTICFVIAMLFYSKTTDNQIVKNEKQIFNYPKMKVKIESSTPKLLVKITPKESKILFADRENVAIQKGKDTGIIEKEKNFQERVFEENISYIQGKALSMIPIKQKIMIPQIQYLSPEENEIKYQMTLGDFGEDSTTYQLLNRKINSWQNSVIVSDFTTSMYPYSTQIFAWLKRNSRNSNIKGIVFFTDCDSLGNQTQAKKGMPGQMFLTKGRNKEVVLPIMLNAARNTQNNRDAKENDLEALLYAQQNFPNSKHLILIADNDAPPKDMHLLSQLKKPVHVVLCGTTSDSTQAFQTEYLEIASKTNGSIHTLEDDINPNDLGKNTWVKVGKNYYHYKPLNEKFKLSIFKHRPRKMFGFLWF